MMKKQIIRTLALTLAALLLCGCQGGPAQEKIAAAVETTQAAIAPSAVAQATEAPSVEVIPHFITGEDARRVAELLLPGIEFYEMEKEGAERYSKEEAQRKIDFYTGYTGGMDNDTYAMAEDGTDLSTREVIDRSVAYWKRQLDAAGQENPHTPCDWTMKSDSHYFDVEAEEGKNVLFAMAMAGDLDYTLCATAIDQPDREWKISSISLQLPVQQGNLEDRIYRALVCQTTEPSQEQVDFLKERVQGWLDAMDLGSWQVTDSSVKTQPRADWTEYSVCFDAVPVLNGAALDENQALAGEAYGKSHAFFELTAKGDLLRFMLYSPVDEKTGGQG